jgi:polyisoprenoid-binding protein YceI
MNHKLFIKYLIAAFAVIFISAAIPAKNTYTLQKGYTVIINGTSNFHDWNETVGLVNGEGEISWNPDGSFDLNAINIKMNVHSIKSNEGATMNNNTYKALKANANPEIIFTLNLPVKSIQVKSTEKLISAKGNLTIAGKTKAVNMQVKVFMHAPGELAFEGIQTILMTDYDIEPPTALFGTLKTGNKITLSFKTIFNNN